MKSMPGRAFKLKDGRARDFSSRRPLLSMTITDFFSGPLNA